ncbi:MAG: hypothetical protein ABIE94_06225 [archaeon]
MKNSIIVLSIMVILLFLLTACQDDLAGEAGEVYSSKPSPEQEDDGGGGGAEIPDDVPICTPSQTCIGERVSIIDSDCNEQFIDCDYMCQGGECIEEPSHSCIDDNTVRIVNEDGSIETIGCDDGYLCEEGECVAEPEEPATHMECQRMLCVEVEGAGDNTCEQDGDCSHKICTPDGRCMNWMGSGDDECTTNAECESPDNPMDPEEPTDNETNTTENGTSETHFECVGELCMEVNGSGTDECSYNSECQDNQTQPETHKECFEGICVDVDGTGTDECSYNYQCGPVEETPITDTHKVCQSGMCIATDGAGTDKCTYNYQCISGPTPPAESNDPETDFYVVKLSLEPAEPKLGQTVVLTYRYGNYGPDEGSAALQKEISTPIGGDGDAGPYLNYSAGQSETGTMNITLNQGEGWYGFMLGMVPEEAGYEQNWYNNNLTVRFYAELGNCSDYNGNICTRRAKCTGEWIDCLDSDRCCSGECVKKNFWELFLDFFTGNL